MMSLGVKSALFHETSGESTTFEESGSSCCICGEIRAPRSLFIGLGAFFVLQARKHNNRRLTMLKNEIAFAKQAILTTRDWDTFQAILRKCLACKTPQPSKK